MRNRKIYSLLVGIGILLPEEDTIPNWNRSLLILHIDLGIVGNEPLIFVVVYFNFLSPKYCNQPTILYKCRLYFNLFYLMWFSTYIFFILSSFFLQNYLIKAIGQMFKKKEKRKRKEKRTNRGKSRTMMPLVLYLFLSSMVLS